MILTPFTFIFSYQRTNERRLDSELLKLEENIRNQTREKNQLFREKEQLQWKIKEKMSMNCDNNLHSQSFSGVVDHRYHSFILSLVFKVSLNLKTRWSILLFDFRNFKTYTFQHSSLNCTAPAADGHLSLTGKKNYPKRILKF